MRSREEIRQKLNESSAQLGQGAKKGGARLAKAYNSGLHYVAQEKAWDETHKVIAELVEVVSAQHAMILDLIDRVAALEAQRSLH